MPETHHCLHCGQPVALDDINVDTDVALCRACGRSMPFSAIADGDELARVDLAQPPRGVKVDRSLISGLDLTYRRFNPAVLFLIPFTAVWSGFSLWGIYGSQIASGRFDPVISLAGLPFLLGTMVLVSVILYMLLGRWRVHIDRGTARVFHGLGPLGRHREIALRHDTQVSLVASRVRVNGQPRREIRVITDDARTNFGATLPEDVRLFLAALLRQAARAG
jgi:hypothetical protein